MLGNVVVVVEAGLEKFSVRFDQLHAVLIVRTESTKRFEIEVKVGSVDEKK
jgi:hypothetical protein